MKTPFFSIVTPTLNEEHYIPKLLKDLEIQKEKNFEIIIVDSQSKDKTKEAVLQFKKLPLRYFENDLKNVSVQRNFGAFRAHGKYLVFLDADTRITPGFTHKLQQIILKKKGLFFIPKIKTDDPVTETQTVVDILNFIVEFTLNSSRPFALGGGMIFERNFFVLLGGFDETMPIGEDFDIAQRSVKWGVRGKFIRELAVTYSLRRLRREGKLKVYYKYFLSVIQYLIHGKNRGNLIEYEMGGQQYKGDHIKRKNNFQTMLDNAKKNLMDFLKE